MQQSLDSVHEALEALSSYRYPWVAAVHKNVVSCKELYTNVMENMRVADMHLLGSR